MWLKMPADYVFLNCCSRHVRDGGVTHSQEITIRAFHLPEFADKQSVKLIFSIIWESNNLRTIGRTLFSMRRNLWCRCFALKVHRFYKTFMNV